MSTTIIKNVKYPQPGDKVIDRQWNRPRYDWEFDDLIESAHYVYTVERPIPPLPLGTIIKRGGTGDWRMVKVAEDRWMLLGRPEVTTSEDQERENLAIYGATIEYKPEA